MEKMPIQPPATKTMWALRLRLAHQKMLLACARESKTAMTTFIEWLIDQFAAHPEKAPPLRDRPPRESTDRKMWACRLSEEHMKSLQASADFCNMSRPEFLEWRIESYYREHILNAKTKRTK